ncbi:MAG: HipA domain-containing protein [Chitinophagaceae bacterium]
MNPHKLTHCPGTLTEGFSTYSPRFLRRMFGGKRVSHILPYYSPQKDEEVAELFLQNRKRISISGVQEKLSLVLEKGVLRLTKEGEEGTYILKPIPSDLKKVTQLPANEHLTMQIATQVYGLNTAEAGMIFFKDGTPAYITKRFDVRQDGGKYGKDDFASLAGKTKDNAGPDFKYAYNYEDAGLLLQKFAPAWRVEIEKYFALVVFNYLFANGDAHLKNFALLESDSGDYRLSPAYDLVNTRLHVDDSDFALSGGLFADGYQSEGFKISGHSGKEDFMKFARRIGVLEKRAEKLLQPFMERQVKVESLIGRSYLDVGSKRGYLHSYQARRNWLSS